MPSSPHRLGHRPEEAHDLGTCHLSAAQLTRLESILHAHLEELHDRIARAEDQFGSLAGDSSVDGATRQAVRLEAEQAREVLRVTNSAITAIAEGTYGTCATCRRQIPFERLEAVPATSTCVACPDA